ncbi:MAG: hypothetical protein ACW97Z_06450 [Candidatus Hodarchaeales archaeon]|jgi:hypothetical protein
MIRKIVLDELEFINHQLDVCLSQMEELLSSKARNIVWCLFFPAGQFIQQKSLARDTSLELMRIDSRFREMEDVLEERQHPLMSQISEILKVDLITMSEKLVELPERAQYMISQIEGIKEIVDRNIREFSV